MMGEHSRVIRYGLRAMHTTRLHRNVANEFQRIVFINAQRQKAEACISIEVSNAWANYFCHVAYIPNQLFIHRTDTNKRMYER